ncbi:MAG TPA: hypothetical protein VGF55_26895 [Gemmataceae bacterium]|jgi:hypothetical protein
MTPNNDTPERSTHPAESAGADRIDANGAGTGPEPQPIPVTPELLEWAMQQWQRYSEEQIAAELRDMLENGGGISSEEFLRGLKEAAGTDG